MKFIPALRSELLKLKRTVLFYLVPIGAFIIPLIMVFDYGTPGTPRSVDSWENFYMEGTQVMVFAFLPLFFVMTSTLLMQIEVRNNTWKQVLASPQSYFTILLSKFIVLQLMGLTFIMAYNVFMIGGAALLDALFANRNQFLSYLSHGREILKISFMAWSSTIGISAVCFWMALRSKNFIAPIAIGFVLWMAGPLAALEFKWPYADRYVFALNLTILSKRYEHEQGFHQLLSFAYGFFFLAVAYLEFVVQRTKVFKWNHSRDER